ncbi:hypothetical protein RhiirA5_506249 [Rhizophagus irregularis]|uniref:Uncharacterized protein n=1 Tax=Rhizophagus irregularis TaxID=588596 RepID=A0A2N0NUN7_9GLOM|nr:hypothetical protein RhiirA5_506249 [Rhizophagus irregularis]
MDWRSWNNRGVVIDEGKFPWNNGRFPIFTNPSPDYHGLIYWDTFEYNAFTMKARSKIMRNIGPMSNPFGSFLLIQGLKTLLLRIWTYLAFGVKGDANVRGLEPHSLMLYYLQDAKTLVIHSSSTTHQQLMDEEQLSAGVNKKMIRLTRIYLCWL